MKNKSTVPQEILRNVPRSPLSDRAEERIEETYRLLGAQEKPRKSHKRAWISSLSAVAACFLLLFGTNAAFPAFAENLPIIGGFFQRINSSYSEAFSSAKTKQGTHAGEYAEPVNVSVESGEYHMNVESAFCDGHLFTFSMRITAPVEVVKDLEYAFPENRSATVNGVEAKTVVHSSIHFWPTENPGELLGAMLFLLPEAVDNGTELSVSLALSNFRGKDIAVKSSKDLPIIFEGTDFRLDFTVTADTGSNVEFDCHVEDNDMILNHVEITPIRSHLNMFMFPKMVAPVLYLPNGTPLFHNSNCDTETGDYATGFTKEIFFDGVPSGTEQVILRIEQSLNHDPTAEILAEFTIDLKNGTAAPSRTWEEDGVLKKDGPFDYSSLQNYIVEEGKPEEYVWYDESQTENDLLIGNIDYKAEPSLFALGVYHAISPYREIKAEILNADGDVVAEGLSSDNSLCNSAYKSSYFNEKCSYWDMRVQNGTLVNYEYNIVLSSEYRPAFGETLTIRVSDPETGEVLTTADRTMIYKDY